MDIGAERVEIYKQDIGYYFTLNNSLRKQRVFHDATTGFPAK